MRLKEFGPELAGAWSKESDRVAKEGYRVRDQRWRDGRFCGRRRGCGEGETVTILDGCVELDKSQCPQNEDYRCNYNVD